MDLRYGAGAAARRCSAWSTTAAGTANCTCPPKGYLFNPDRYPFQEGRSFGSERQPGQRLTPPLVPDGVLFRVLHNLLVLDGERLSYRSLDVEQIGSVYETVMGFRLEVPAAARSPSVRPSARGTDDGQPGALLACPADRGKWLKEQTDQGVTAGRDALKAADTVEAPRPPWTARSPAT